MHTTLRDMLSRYRTHIDILDIELLIAHVLEKSREFVLTHLEDSLSVSQTEAIEKLLNRRAQHEPIAYILGTREFFGLNFDVTKDTLIPRPETELMVEEILKSIDRHNREGRACDIIDVGTGSGAIAISVAHELLKNESENDRHTFSAVDISEQAIAVAKENAKKNHLEKKISFAHSDLLENVSAKLLEKKIDTLIVAANLPYLSYAIYESSMDDVKNFEPKSALVSEEEGLHHYRRLLEQLKKIHAAKPNTRIELFFEISPEQKDALEKMIVAFFPNASTETLHDLSGKYRLAVSRIY